MYPCLTLTKHLKLSANRKHSNKRLKSSMRVIWCATSKGKYHGGGGGGGGIRCYSFGTGVHKIKTIICYERVYGKETCDRPTMLIPKLL